MRKCVVALAVVVCSTGVAWAQTGDKGAVDGVRTAFMKASNAGDVAGLVAFYTADAVVMAPDTPMVKGKANIEALHRKMMDMARVSGMTITPIDTQVLGDTAIDVGTYQQTLTPKGGTPVTDTGKYLVVLKKQADGSWKLQYEIYNSDKQVMMPSARSSASKP
jgi:uncharacterized protein (TIGR02246 family)